MLALRGLALVSVLVAVSCTDVSTDKEFITDVQVICKAPYKVLPNALLKVMEEDVRYDDDCGSYPLTPTEPGSNSSQVVHVRVAPRSDFPTPNNEFYFEFFNVCLPGDYYKFRDCTKVIYIIP